MDYVTVEAFSHNTLILLLIFCLHFVNIKFINKLYNIIIKGRETPIMKGLILMAKYNIIRTMEDKAGFIADNMEIEYDGIDFDGVLLFTIRIDKTIYSVSDHEGYSTFFERYCEASNYAEDLIETLVILKDDFDEKEVPTIRLAKNHISFSETIRGDDIDSCNLCDLFDNYAFDEVKLLTKAVLCDGDIKETFVEVKEGE